MDDMDEYIFLPSNLSLLFKPHTFLEGGYVEPWL